MIHVYGNEEETSRNNGADWKLLGVSCFLSSNGEINKTNMKEDDWSLCRNVYFLFNSKWRRRKRNDHKEGKLKSCRVGKKF